MKKASKATSKARKLRQEDQLSFPGLTASQNSSVPPNGLKSEDGVDQCLDRRDKVSASCESSNHSLSPARSMEDITTASPLPAPPTLADTARSRLPNRPAVLTDEYVLRIGILPHQQRLELLPGVFDSTGRVRKPWTHLRPQLNSLRAAKKESDQAAAHKPRTQPPFLVAPAGIPKGFNAASPPLATKEGIDGSRSPSQEAESEHCSVYLEDDGEASDYSPSRPPERLSKTALNPDRPFSGSSKKIVTYSRKHSQNANKASTPSQPRSHPNRRKRSLPAQPLKILDPLTPSIWPVPPDEHGPSPLFFAQASMSPPHDRGPSTPERDTEKNRADTITVESILSPGQVSPRPIPFQECFVLLSPDRSEQATAAPSLCDENRQHSLNLIFCDTCHNSICSCNSVHVPHEKIFCSFLGCSRNGWTEQDLWNLSCIKLSDAQETERKFKCWFCPLCSSKAQALLKATPISPHPLLSTDVPNSGSARPEDFIPDSGAWPEDGEIQKPLFDLTAIMRHYTDSVNIYFGNMSKSQALLKDPQMPIRDIPLVHQEALQPAEAGHNAISILRQLLDVPDGVLIMEKVRETKLEEISCSIWIHAILSFLFTTFVFKNGSPFEDATLLKETLMIYSGLSMDQAEDIIHDHRIRIIQAYKADAKTNDANDLIPVELRDRILKRKQAFIELLNITMLPLVGGSSQVQKRHLQIADIASELNLRVHAYRGEFEAIRPQILDPFDFECHVEEDSEPGDLPGQNVLVTTMLGIRYKHPDKGWRVCSPAKVKVYPARDALPNTRKRIPLPDVPGGSINPRKRRIEEIL